MGKVKQQLEQDMMLNPWNYNNPDPSKKEMGGWDEELSNCCRSLRYNDTDVCLECRKPAKFSSNKDELENIKHDNRRDTL